MKLIFLKNSSIIFSLLVCIGLTGCYYDKEEELYPDSGPVVCDTLSVSYSSDIVPILSTNCSYSGCHSSSSEAAGISLETYSGVKDYLDADKSQFISAIIWDGNASNMPKNATQKLSVCSINTINAWINDGYPNN